MNFKKKYNLIQTLLLILTLLIAKPIPALATDNTQEKDNGVLAIEVIQGLWGNGEERRERLTDAGYIYQDIQDLVNAQYGILYAVSLPVENKTVTKEIGIQEAEKPTQKQEVKKVAKTAKVKKAVETPKVKKVVQKPKAKKIVKKQTQSSGIYSLRDLQFHGVIRWKGYKFTFYSSKILPGKGLRIPGRHINASGYVADKDGYIVLANDAPKGTVIPTPFGYMGKVYDRGTYGNHYDVYTR